MAFASDSTIAPARPLLPLPALDRRAIGRDGWARARELAAQLGGEIRDHFAEGMRQAWAAARGLLQGDSPAPSRSVDQVGSSDLVPSYPDHVGAPPPLLPLPAPLPSLTAALSRRRAIFGAVVPDTLDAIRADLDAMLGRVDAFAAAPDASIEPEAGEALAREGRHLYTRRALERAANHAAAMLPALGLPRLVGPDFTPVDPVAAGDALDAAIAALDALDGNPDLEDEPDDEAGGDDELSLGWREALRQLDLGHGSDDGEHTLGAPERHPYLVSPSASYYKPARGGRLTRCFDTRAWNQAQWAAGSREDGEGESEEGYDLPEGDDERCGSEHDGCEPDEQEHSLGAPAGDGDQRRWAQGYENDVEADPCDGPGAYLTAEKRQAARDRRPELNALANRARALARPVPLSYFDPDTVTPIGPGMMSWGGPVRHPLSLCNVNPVAARVVPSGSSWLLEVEA